METELWERVYESMTCHVSEGYRMPGVEDEAADVECMIQCYMEIQRELCKRMFLYGQKTGFTKFS